MVYSADRPLLSSKEPVIPGSNGGFGLRYVGTCIFECVCVHAAMDGTVYSVIQVVR